MKKMTYLGLFILLLLNACGTNTNEKVPTTPLNSRGIRNGETDSNANPLVPGIGALIQYRSDGQSYLCTASLIDRDLILTAAHCLKENDTLLMDATKYFFTLNASFGETSSYLNISEIFVHPEYRPELPGGFDVAILKLSAPILNISPLILNRGQISLTSNMDVQTVGYGLSPLTFGDRRYGTMKYQNLVPHVSSNGQSVGIAEYKSGDTGQIICQGDSGGPQLVNNNGINYLVSVSSNIRLFVNASGPCSGVARAYSIDVNSVGQWIFDRRNELYRPLPATNLTISVPTNPANTFKINWQHSGLAVTGFGIYSDDNGSKGQLLRTVSASTREVNMGPYSEGESHRFFVSALNGEFISLTSTIVVGTLPVTVPAAPSGLFVRPYTFNPTQQFKLDWIDNSTNEDGFTLESQNSSGQWERFQDLNPNTRQFVTPTGVFAQGATVRFRVKSKKGNLLSTSTNEAEATLDYSQPLISTLSAFSGNPSRRISISIAGGTHVNFRTEVYDNLGQAVLKADGSPLKFNIPISAAANWISPVGIPEFAAGRTYQIRVKAVNSIGVSSSYATKTVTLHNSAPVILSAVRWVNNKRRLQLSWAAPQNEIVSAYNLEILENLSNGTMERIHYRPNLNATVYTFISSSTELMDLKKSYTVRLRAKNVEGAYSRSADRVITPSSP